jgi:hypothetical protein
MFAGNLSDRVQPMVDESAPLAVHRRADAATIMPHHDVLHLDHIDRELQHGGEIGDIAVHEQFARIEIDDLIGGHAAVGAADPEVFRRLLAHQPLEEAASVETIRAAQARLLALR